MKAYTTRAVVATLVLLLLGASVPMTWSDLGRDDLSTSGAPKGIEAEIADISERDRLKEIALLLIQSNNASAAVQQETIGLVKTVLVMVGVSAALGIGFVWNCVIGCVKEERRAKGEALGWLRWL